MKKFVPPISARLLAGLPPESSEKSPDSPGSLYVAVVDLAYRISVSTGVPVENHTVTGQAVQEGLIVGKATEHRSQALVSQILNQEARHRDGRLKKIERGRFDVKK